MRPSLRGERRNQHVLFPHPFLVGMLVAISVFRASGALDFIVQSLNPLLSLLHFPSEVLPLAIIRPISGTAALGITSDLISVYGPDSFVGRLAATIQEVRIPPSMY